MNSEAGRLIDLATRPLADNAELRLAAESELRKSLEAHAEMRPEAVSEAAESLERADRHPKRGRWKVALYALALLVSLPIIIHSVRQISRSAGIRSVISPMSPVRKAPAKIPNLDASESLLLYGDENARSRADRWKKLWESEPENPAYLAEYAGAAFLDHKKLPPEVLSVAGRIDPDNGWFLGLAAAEKAEAAVKRETRTAKEVKERKGAVLTVLDDGRLQEALAIIHQAVGKRRFDSYQTEQLRKRIPLFPPRTDFVSQIPLMVHVAGKDTPSVSFRRLPDVLAAGAQRCAEKGDVEGFRGIIGDWRALVSASTRDGDTMIDLLVARVMLIGPALHFRDAATALGLEQDARYFGELDDRGKKETEDRKNRRGKGGDQDALRMKSSILGGLSSPMLARQVQSPPALTEEMLRPARYADHALYGRAVSGLGWFVFAVAVLAAATSRYRRAPLAGPLSRRMTDLLRPLDWMGLLLGGVVFPVLWYLAITRLTPLSARDWSVAYLMFIPIVGQFLSFLLSLLILPSVIASMLLARRGAVFGLRPRFPRVGWLAAVIALAGVPAFGAAAHWGRSEYPVLAAFAFPICALIVWILSGLGSKACNKEERTLRRATLTRILLPVWAAGMLLFALLARFHYAEEQYWIQRDRMGEITTEAPASSRYEYEVVQVLRRETLEMLGQPPESR